MDNDCNEDKNETGFLASLIDPELREGRVTRLVEKRNLVSSVFIAMLIGLAYQEMIAPVRDTVRSSGLTLNTIVLILIFFLVSMRFFIGNQLHLLSEQLVILRGDIWFYDFLVITLQTLLLAFLGGVTSVEISKHAEIGFVEILLTLYITDVVWIVSQWVFGKIIPKWKREFIPWAWALLNFFLIIGIAIVYSLCTSIYSMAGLLSLLGLNLFAFLIDIILVDHYRLI